MSNQRSIKMNNSSESISSLENLCHFELMNEKNSLLFNNSKCNWRLNFASLYNNSTLIKNPQDFTSTALGQEEAKDLSSRKVYVGNLPRSISDEELKDLFSQFGTVQSAYISNKKVHNPYKYGFVTFEAESSAIKAKKQYKLSFKTRKVIIREFELDKKIKKKKSNPTKKNNVTRIYKNNCNKNNEKYYQFNKHSNKKTTIRNTTLTSEKIDQLEGKQKCKKLNNKSSAQKAIIKFVLQNINKNHYESNLKLKRSLNQRNSNKEAVKKNITYQSLSLFC